MADGSLKFDTKVNTDGFEEGISTLEGAMNRLTKAVNRLSQVITNSFSGAGNALKEMGESTSAPAEGLEEIADTAKEAKDEVAELQKQMDAITVNQMEDISPSAESGEKRSVEVKTTGYDQEAMRFIEDYINEVGSAEEHTNEFKQQIGELEARLKELSGAGLYFGDEEYDEAYLKLAKIKQALADYKKEMLSPTETKADPKADEEARLRAIADAAEVSNQKVVELNQQLQELQARQKELQAANVGLGHTEYDQNVAAIKELTEELQEYRKSVEGAEEETYKFGDCTRAMAETGNIGLMVLGAFADMTELAIAALRKLASAGFELAKAAAKKFFDVVAQIAKSALNQLANAAKKAAQGMMGLGRSFLSGNKQAGALNRGLGSLIKRFVVYRIVRKLVSSIASGFSEGMKNFAGYSSAFNATMSSFVSSLNQLKNSFASAFSPIISAVMPVLDALIQKLIYAINVIGQFLAALTGKGTFSKAVKVNKDYADSVKGAGSAAKKAGSDAKKALAPFDDLNQVQGQSTSDGGGGTDFGSMFEDVAIDQGISDFAQKLKDAFAAGDWKGIGRILGEKINDVVSRITDFVSWKNCGEQITKFINAFTAMFNSLVATIDWYAVGMMFGAGIDTLAHTLYLLLTGIDWFLLGAALGTGINGLVDRVNWDIFGRTIGAYFQAKISGLYGFVTTVDWGNIGRAISGSLMGMIGEINWGMLGLLFAESFNAVFKTVGEFARNFNWSGLGSSLAFSLSTFFQTFDWAGAGTAISDIVIGLLDALITFVIETDWYAFGQGVSTGIQSIDWAGIVSGLFAFIGAFFGGFAAFLGGLLADGVAAAQAYFQGKIEECGGSVVKGILKGIVDGLLGIGAWIVSNVFKPFIDGFKNAFGIHSPSTKMAEMGKYLWDGFCKGIKDFFSNPGAFIKANITDPFVNSIKSLLGIHSPSTVLEGIGGNTVSGFNQGVTKGQNSTQSVIQSWATGVAGWFASKLGISSGNSSEAKQWANSTMSGYNNSVMSNYTKSQGAMETWAESVRKWFVGSGEGQGVNEASWKKYAGNIVSAFKAGIEGCYSQSQSPMATWSRMAREWFWGDSNPSGTGGMYQKFYEMAQRINEGFARGISDFAHLSKTAIQKWAGEITDGARGKFDINSPSKEFRVIAEFVVRGFNNGIADLMSSSVSAARKWLDGVMDVFAGVEIQIPMGLDIPNAASYLPKIASGTIVPPRAGEIAAILSGNGQTAEAESLLDTLRQMAADVREAMQALGGDTHITLELEGESIYQSVIKRNQQAAGRTGQNPLVT